MIVWSRVGDGPMPAIGSFTIQPQRRIWGGKATPGERMVRASSVLRDQGTAAPAKDELRLD